MSAAASSSSSSSEEAQNEVQLNDANVLTKYKTAANIVNAALQLVIKASVAGAKIVELCTLGDKFVEDETAKIYNKGSIPKGSAFPTCISLNHTVGHFSPLKQDDTTLKLNDLVKVDLGVHIDGYVVVGAHSFVVGASSSSPLTGKVADVMHAAQTAGDAVLRLLKPGNSNTQVTDLISKISEDYGVTAVAGVLSHNMKRFILDGEKVILNRFDPEQQSKVESCKFEEGEVWAVDLVFSTGDGKPREVDERTTVFKRNVEQVYQLRLKASRAILSEIDKKFPHFPFSIRNLDEEKKARVAVVECSTHGLLQAYPVLHEKEGEFVCHIKYTALVTASGTTKITGLPFDFATYKSEKKPSEAVRAILQLSTKAKKQKDGEVPTATPASSSSSAAASSTDASK